MKIIKTYHRYYQQKKWRQQFEQQLVEGLTAINNGLRAGLMLPQALELSSQYLTGPFAEEMKAIAAQMQNGQPLLAALQHSARHVNVPDWHLVVQTCAILLELGGNLISSFQQIVDTIRERQKVQDKIRTATTQGKMQAYIIGSMPFVLATVLYFCSPDYLTPLGIWPWGPLLCVVGVAFLTIGAVWMRHIIQIEV